MVQALLAKADPTFDPVEGLKQQANQVSIISVCNFSGRVIVGLWPAIILITLNLIEANLGFLADFGKHRLGFPRSFNISLLAFGFVISQLVASHIEDIQHLWIASSVLGVSYGMLFGIFPTVVIEWFGLGMLWKPGSPLYSNSPHTWFIQLISPKTGVSSVLRLLSVGILLLIMYFIQMMTIAGSGGNLFSLAFGRNLDRHDPTLNKPSNASFVRIPLPDNSDEIIHRCIQGRLCYVDTLRLTTLGCTLALMLATYAGLRDWRRRKAVSEPWFDDTHLVELWLSR